MARKTSFYYAFLVLPRDQRRAIIAVWDFCRVVDDAVDEAKDADGARRALQCWRAELARCYGPEAPQTPQGVGLKPFVKAFDLPRDAFEQVIEGVAMDLDTTRYESFDQLLTYCHRVASAVGLICINIFGCRDPGARQYALDLGVALQLTNILRDIKDDLARGRLYLPLEDVRAAGCRVEDLAAGVVTASVRNLMAFECRRAHRFYEQALRSRPLGERRRLVAAEIMRAVYYETLVRIEQNDYDVFSRPIRLAKPVQAAIALRQWVWPR